LAPHAPTSNNTAAKPAARPTRLEFCANFRMAWALYVCAEAGSNVAWIAAEARPQLHQIRTERGLQRELALGHGVLEL
jgi:hypothetical protein